MKKFFRFIYTTYHLLLPSRNRTCRFTPTCSEYFLEATTKYGTLKGSYLSLKRLTSCHPFSKRAFYDPLPADKQEHKKNFKFTFRQKTSSKRAISNLKLPA